MLEKSGQNPSMHAPPGGIGTTVRRLVSLVCCFVILYGSHVLRYLNVNFYVYD